MPVAARFSIGAARNDDRSLEDVRRHEKREVGAAIEIGIDRDTLTGRRSHDKRWHLRRSAARRCWPAAIPGARKVDMHRHPVISALTLAIVLVFVSAFAIGPLPWGSAAHAAAGAIASP